jgi:hypothetical protein
MGASFSEMLSLFSLSLRVDRHFSSLLMLSRTVLLCLGTSFASGDINLDCAIDAPEAAMAFAAMALVVTWAVKKGELEEALRPPSFASFKSLLGVSLNAFATKGEMAGPLPLVLLTGEVITDGVGVVVNWCAVGDSDTADIIGSFSAPVVGEDRYVPMKSVW